MAEQAHAPALRVEQAEHDAKQRRLAGAIRADDSEKVPGLHREVDTIEDPHLAMAERHVLELDEGSHRARTGPSPRRRRPSRAVSHHAAAAAQPAPRKKPPSTSVGQWACSTTRAQPTSTII